MGLNKAPCAVTQIVPIAKSKESDDYFKGGILKGNKYAWLSQGPFLSIIDIASGQKIGGWKFGAMNSEFNTEVSCVIELPFNEDSSNVKQIIVGLKCEVVGGMICILDIRGSRLLRAIHIPGKPISLSIVDNGSSGCEGRYPLPGLLSSMSGIIAVGVEGGKVLLIDLCRITCEELLNTWFNDNREDLRDEMNPCQLIFISKDEEDSALLERKRVAAAVSGDHLCLLLNESAFLQELFLLLEPRGDVYLSLQAQTVEVTSLLYVPRIASLAIGFNFGCFQLWNLMHLTLNYTSHLMKDPLPVVNLGFQEPSDDPCNFCYLWAVHSSIDGSSKNPVGIMYALSYDCKEWVDGYGYLYQDYQSCHYRFEYSFVDTSDDVSNICCTSFGTVSNMPTQKNVSEDGFDESITSENDVSLCFFTWETYDEEGKPISSHLSLFDLNQWYKDQMPSRINDSDEDPSGFLVSFLLNSIRENCETETQKNMPILDVKVDSQNLSQFKSFQPQEEHYHPSALSFVSHGLLEDRIVTVNHPGLQKYILLFMEKEGPSCLLRPTSLFKHSVMVGLRPILVEIYGSSDVSVGTQREYLLSVALENQMQGFLYRCASDWANGSVSGADCSLPMLLNWGFQRAWTLKETAHNLCVHLFDHTGVRLDENECRLLDNCASQLRQITTLFEGISRDGRLLSLLNVEDFKEKTTELSLVALYFEVLLWFLNVGLLPEFPENELCNIDEENNKFIETPGLKMAYPASTLIKIYQTRRQEFKSLNFKNGTKASLYIDQLLQNEPNGSQLSELWQSDCGSGMYPPPSVQSLLVMYLQDGIDIQTKNSIVIYVFLDLASILDNEKYSSIIEYFVKFPCAFCMTPSIIKVTQAFWLLDQKHYEDALDMFLDPLVSPKDLQPWQHRFIVHCLLSQNQHAKALEYFIIRQLPVQGIEDIKLKISLLVMNKQVTQAYNFLQQYRNEENNKELLVHFFEECGKAHQLGTVLKLMLSTEEEDLLMNYLQNCNLSQSDDMQVVFYLMRSRIIEAVAVNEKINFSNSRKINSSRRVQNDPTIRDILVDGYSRTLPSVTRQLANYCSQQKKSLASWRQVERPTPMSVDVHYGSQKSVSYKSSLIHATLEKARETWMETPYNSFTKYRDSMDFTSMKNLPFLCTANDSFKQDREIAPVVFPSMTGQPVKRRCDDDENSYTPLKRSRLENSPTMDNFLFHNKKREYNNFSGNSSLLFKSPLVKRITPLRQPTENISVKSNSKTADGTCTPQSILKVRHLDRGSVSPMRNAEMITRNLDADFDKLNEDKLSSRQIRFSLPAAKESLPLSSSTPTHAVSKFTSPSLVTPSPLLPIKSSLSLLKKSLVDDAEKNSVDEDSESAVTINEKPSIPQDVFIFGSRSVGYSKSENRDSGDIHEPLETEKVNSQGDDTFYSAGSNSNSSVSEGNVEEQSEDVNTKYDTKRYIHGIKDIKPRRQLARLKSKSESSSIETISVTKVQQVVSWKVEQNEEDNSSYSEDESENDISQNASKKSILGDTFIDSSLCKEQYSVNDVQGDESSFEEPIHLDSMKYPHNIKNITPRRQLSRLDSKFVKDCTETGIFTSKMQVTKTLEKSENNDNSCSEEDESENDTSYNVSKNSVLGNTTFDFSLCKEQSAPSDVHRNESLFEEPVESSVHQSSNKGILEKTDDSFLKVLEIKGRRPLSRLRNSRNYSESSPHLSRNLEKSLNSTIETSNNSVIEKEDVLGSSSIICEEIIAEVNDENENSVGQVMSSCDVDSSKLYKTFGNVESDTKNAVDSCLETECVNTMKKTDIGADNGNLNVNLRDAQDNPEIQQSSLLHQEFDSYGQEVFIDREEMETDNSLSMVSKDEGKTYASLTTVNVMDNSNHENLFPLMRDNISIALELPLKESGNVGKLLPNQSYDSTNTDGKQTYTIIDENIHENFEVLPTIIHSADINIPYPETFKSQETLFSCRGSENAEGYPIDVSPCETGNTSGTTIEIDSDESREKYLESGAMQQHGAEIECLGEGSVKIMKHPITSVVSLSSIRKDDAEVIEVDSDSGCGNVLINKEKNIQDLESVGSSNYSIYVQEQSITNDDIICGEQGKEEPIVLKLSDSDNEEEWEQQMDKKQNLISSSQLSESLNKLHNLTQSDVQKLPSFSVLTSSCIINEASEKTDNDSLSPKNKESHVITCVSEGDPGTEEMEDIELCKYKEIEKSDTLSEDKVKEKSVAIAGTGTVENSGIFTRQRRRRSSIQCDSPVIDTALSSDQCSELLEESNTPRRRQKKLSTSIPSEISRSDGVLESEQSTPGVLTRQRRRRSSIQFDSPALEDAVKFNNETERNNTPKTRPRGRPSSVQSEPAHMEDFLEMEQSANESILSKQRRRRNSLQQESPAVTGENLPVQQNSTPDEIATPTRLLRNRRCSSVQSEPPLLGDVCTSEREEIVGWLPQVSRRSINLRSSLRQESPAVTDEKLPEQQNRTPDEIATPTRVLRNWRCSSVQSEPPLLGDVCTSESEEIVGLSPQVSRRSINLRRRRSSLVQNEDHAISSSLLLEHSNRENECISLTKKQLSQSDSQLNESVKSKSNDEESYIFTPKKLSKERKRRNSIPTTSLDNSSTPQKEITTENNPENEKQNSNKTSQKDKLTNSPQVIQELFSNVHNLRSSNCKSDLSQNNIEISDKFHKNLRPSQSESDLSVKISTSRMHLRKENKVATLDITIQPTSCSSSDNLKKNLRSRRAQSEGREFPASSGNKLDGSLTESDIDSVQSEPPLLGDVTEVRQLTNRRAKKVSSRKKSHKVTYFLRFPPPNLSALKEEPENESSGGDQRSTNEETIVPEKSIKGSRKRRDSMSSMSSKSTVILEQRNKRKRSISPSSLETQESKKFMMSSHENIREAGKQSRKEGNAGSDDSIEQYATARRLTRYQRNVMERSLDVTKGVHSDYCASEGTPEKSADESDSASVASGYTTGSSQMRYSTRLQERRLMSMERSPSQLSQVSPKKQVSVQFHASGESESSPQSVQSGRSSAASSSQWPSPSSVSSQHSLRPSRKSLQNATKSLFSSKHARSSKTTHETESISDLEDKAVEVNQPMSGGDDDTASEAGSLQSQLSTASRNTRSSAKSGIGSPRRIGQVNKEHLSEQGHRERKTKGSSKKVIPSTDGSTDNSDLSSNISQDMKMSGEDTHNKQKKEGRKVYSAFKSRKFLKLQTKKKT